MERHPNGMTWCRKAALVLAASCAVASIGAHAARADDTTSCPSSTDAAYGMQLRALTGPAGADLTVAVASAPGCETPGALKKIQIKTYAADGSLERVRNLVDVDAPGGSASLDLGQLPRDSRVEADVLVQTGTPRQTYVVRGATTTLLRPDLVVASIDAPRQTLVTRPVDLHAVLAELNGDVGASSTATLSWGPSVLATQPVTLEKGGHVTVDFTGIALTTAQPVELTIRISDATPYETDATNNTRAATIDVTEHELAAATVLFPSLVGYGAQFNNHVYAPITPWPAGVPYGDFENKVKALQPQLVRIFYNDNWDGNQDKLHPEWQQNYASFVKVAQLAQEAGATIDISFQNLGTARLAPLPAMAKFADVLDDLVRHYGIANVRWAEVGNEPNAPTGAVTLEQYNALYRALDAELVARGLREHIHLMGGGLVESNGARSHYVWLKWIAANMGDIVDAYAEHIYWIYNDSGRLEYRLRDSARLMNEVLPPEQRKPTYMMEFGIRGLGTCGSKPAFPNLYYASDPSCQDIWRTNIAGFQQLWFNIASAQLGVAGTAKWDEYWGRYDKTLNNQVYWTIGPPTEGSPLTPTYHSESLLFHVTEPGWQIVRVEPWDDSDSSVPQFDLSGGHSSNDQPEQELVGYAGPNGEVTLVGLDTHGKDVNTASTDPPSSYSIGGLPAGTTFNLAVWNATGDGTNSIAGQVTANDAGVARFTVPLQAAFALTTVPVS